jgi:methionyl-tRNA synthetase
MSKFFVTTPIYYINAEPSIGSACTTVAADIIARLHRQHKEEVFFLTGTDEHGEKVAEVAQKKGLSPIEYSNQIAPKFEEAWKILNISHDFFIRTTNSLHEKVVSQFIQKIYDEGDIYKDKYNGWYCTGCEAFKTEKELVDLHCPLHPPEKTVKKTEENWFFKLSKYIPKLIELIENNKTNYIYPDSKRTEILAKLKSGVNDISISREKVKWGIPVPWDTDHTIYVWVDALINYYSATQFLENKKDFWPANLHLLGKEILWFHTVIWQAMLLSAKLPIPIKTYTHDFYTIDSQKMSKSLGNTIPPREIVDLFGIDGARYLIARSFPSNGDADVGITRFKERYNADLANNLGNLVSRICKLASNLQFPKNNFQINDDFNNLIDNLKFDEAISWVFSKFIDESNNRLNVVSPWKLEADDPARVAVLTECVNNLRAAAYCLTPVMPETCEKIVTALEGEIKPLEKGLFARIA